jgi:hypothetical protein
MLKPTPLPGETMTSVFQKLGSLNSEPALPSTSYLPSTPSVVPASSYIPSSETPPGERPATCQVSLPPVSTSACPRAYCLREPPASTQEGALLLGGLQHQGVACCPSALGGAGYGSPSWRRSKPAALTWQTNSCSATIFLDLTKSELGLVTCV